MEKQLGRVSPVNNDAPTRRRLERENKELSFVGRNTPCTGTDIPDECVRRPGTSANRYRENSARPDEGGPRSGAKRVDLGWFTTSLRDPFVNLRAYLHLDSSRGWNTIGDFSPRTPFFPPRFPSSVFLAPDYATSEEDKARIARARDVIDLRHLVLSIGRGHGSVVPRRGR